KGLRVELHEIAPAGPGVAPAAEEVLHLVSLALAPGEVQPAGLDVLRVEVDDNEYEIVFRFFTENQQMVVVGGMELEAPVALQRDVLPPNPVQPGDQLG